MRCDLILALLSITFVSRIAAAADPPVGDALVVPTMNLLTAADGSRFGLFGVKQAEPAATLFVFAQSLEYMRDRPSYSEVGQRMAKHGFLYVVVDPPCHGADAKPGEPPELRGWRYRVDHGDALIPPFTKRAIAVLDYLVHEGYTDVERVAVCGTSRGGFLALHFAAADPRIHAVATFSPVTDLAALSEFRGSEQHPTVQALAAINLADRLAGRPVWISIGNNDSRVGTDAAIAVARKFVAAAVAKRPGDPKPIVPVELIVGPSPGHGAIERSQELAAAWLLQQFVTARK